MRRFLPVLFTVASLLALAPESGAKVLLREAEVCGADGCTAETPRVDHNRAFELFGPTIEPGRPTAPAAITDGPRYRVTLTTRPVSGGEVASLDYYPDAGYVHVLGEPGSELGGARLNVGWVRLTRSELDAYGSLANGLMPYEAEASNDPEGNGAPAAIIVPLVAAGALAVLGLFFVLRRGTMAASGSPGPKSAASEPGG
jgi:hypothetical protein